MMEPCETAVVVPDMCVAKTELFDAEFAAQLVDNKNVIKEEREKLKRMLKERRCGNEFHNTYKLGKNCKHEFLGRWCSLKGNGLQNLQGDIRAAIAQKYYTDVDMVNAQPVLLSQYCAAKCWACPVLNEYIEKREALMGVVMEGMGIARWEAKKRIVSLMFGASPTGMPEFFADQLYPELRRLMKNIWTENEASLKWLRKQPNHMGKGMAYILQTEERKCLEAMDRAFARRGYSLDVYIHDGGLVRNREGGGITDDLLRAIEADVKMDTGYTISLIVKPLDTSFEFKEVQDADAVYKAMKDTMEECYFKLMEPPVYVNVDSERFSILKREGLTHQLQNCKMSNGEYFLKKWILDPDIRTYSRLVFSPKKEVRHDEFNLFTEFAIPPKAGGDISKPQELLRIICNNDPAVFDYVENWLAHIIQKPFMKTLVCLIFQGEEGAGKDTFWEFIGDILGKSMGYYFNTTNPEHNVFNIFNSGTERSVLVKFEEASFTTNKANMDKLKGIITGVRENYTRKGVDPITLDDYRNIVMTTNADVPILISDTDRRFMLMKVSSERLGDAAFWGETHEALAKPETKSAYHQYLLTKDISEFVPSRDRIKTEFYNDVKEAQAPYHARFFTDFIYRHENLLVSLDAGAEPQPIEFKAYELMNSMKDFVAGKFDLNIKRFGTDMKHYLDAECIVKKKTKACSVYAIYPARCKDFMVSKHWFSEI